MTLEGRVHRPSPKMTRISATIYGKGGTGKTTLLGTMPGQGLLIDIPQIEGGTVVLGDRDDIDVFEVTKWDDFQEPYDAIKAGLPSPLSARRYDWVAIDSITAAQALATRKAVRERTISGDPMLITQQDWGKIGSLMSQLLFDFRTLPVHVLFTAQERLRETGDVYEYQPEVSPMTLSHLIPSQFLVGRLYTAEVEEDGKMVTERRLRVGNSERYTTKVRAIPGRDLPNIIQNPNLKDIFAWLLGSKNATRPAGIEAQTGGGLFGAVD